MSSEIPHQANSKKSLAPRKSLGRGLSALLGGDSKAIVDEINAVSPSAPSVIEKISKQEPDAHSLVIPIENISPNPNQPRKSFNVESLDSLAQSIKDYGLLQPIIICARGQNRYEIIAGERRWRAAQRAGLKEIPAKIMPMNHEKNQNDQSILKIALVENLQREDLDPIEEALGYQQLIHHHQLTQNNIAEMIGKSRSHIANTLRLLELPEAIVQQVRDGAISSGHARTLIGVANPMALAQRVIDEALSVRQLEIIVKQEKNHDLGLKSPTADKIKNSVVEDSNAIDLENRLSHKLNIKVKLKDKAGQGDLVLHYQNYQELDRLIDQLSKS